MVYQLVCRTYPLSHQPTWRECANFCCQLQLKLSSDYKASITTGLAETFLVGFVLSSWQVWWQVSDVNHCAICNCCWWQRNPSENQWTQHCFKYYFIILSYRSDRSDEPIKEKTWAAKHNMDIQNAKIHWVRHHTKQWKHSATKWHLCGQGWVFTRSYSSFSITNPNSKQWEGLAHLAGVTGSGPQSKMLKVASVLFHKSYAVHKFSTNKITVYQSESTIYSTNQRALNVQPIRQQ